MTTKNDITGDSIQSKASGDAYRNGYDAIWGKKDKREDSAELFRREYQLDPYKSDDKAKGDL